MCAGGRVLEAAGGDQQPAGPGTSMSQCKYFSYQQTNIFSPVQVCDLQKRVQTYSHENDDLTANLRVYQVFIIYVHWIFMELQSLWLDLGSRVKIKLKT